MEGLTHDALFVRDQPVEKGKGKSPERKLKLTGRSKTRFVSLGPSTRKCWQCGKVKH